MSSEPWSNDDELVGEILGGSAEAFGLFYATYFPRIYCFAFKQLRDTDEAEDVTQEVFLTVFRVLANYRGRSSLRVWIFRITCNRTLEEQAALSPGLLSSPSIESQRVKGPVPIRRDFKGSAPLGASRNKVHYRRGVTQR